METLGHFALECQEYGVERLALLRKYGWEGLGSAEKLRKMTGHTKGKEEMNDLLKFYRIAYARRAINLTGVSMRRQFWIGKGRG